MYIYSVQVRLSCMQQELYIAAKAKLASINLPVVHGQQVNLTIQW